MNVNPKFYAVFNNPAPVAPLNHRMIRSENQMVLEKTAQLVAYGKYLADARTYKAQQRSVSQAFEREVLAQARVTQSDMHTLFGSSLRLIKHMKNAGVIDHALRDFEKATQDAGGVQIGDLWNDIVNDPEARGALVDQGVTGEMLDIATGVIQQVDSRVVFEQAHLTVEVKLPGAEHSKRIMMSRTTTRQPHSITALLRQGQFDRIVELFDQPNRMSLDIAPLKHNAPIPAHEIALTGAVLAEQEMARHIRKLEDTGVAIYEGGEPNSILALILIGIVLTAILLSTCEEDPDATSCKIGRILLVLGLILLLIASAVCAAENPTCQYLFYIALFAIVAQLEDA
ncbi:MAG: hypothetical protein K8I60_20865 [Anaerolineae bacterium]|nr:hypothetical protein [Anaerolineae bacterium]